MSRLLSWVRSHPQLKSRLQRISSSVGYDTTDWLRVVMYERAFAFIRTLKPETLDVLEVSAGPHWRREFEFKSFTGTDYPEFDVCSDVLPQQFDLIVADQIFEHLERPMQAAANVHKMLKPGGHFIIATPFLIRVHQSPIDCSRWTEAGLSLLLQDAGFVPEEIRTDSWGNRACVKANLNGWPKRGFRGSLKNEPDVPVMVWAFARKSGVVPLQSAD